VTHEILAVEAVAERAAARGASVVRTAALLPDLTEVHMHYIPLLLTQLDLRNPARERPLPTLEGWMDMLDHHARTQRAFARLFAHEIDAIVMPVAGIEAFAHDDTPLAERMVTIDGRTEPFAPQFAWIGPATYSNHPALAVPVGRTPQGLPIGLQVITARMRDHDAIRLGALLAAA